MWVCHGNSHTICDWKCFRLRVSGYPQSPVHNPNLNRLTLTHTRTHTCLQSRANVYIIWTAVAVALATSFLTSLLLRLSRALSFDPCLQSVGVMFELHSTGVALLCFFCCLCFFCFILFCSFLCSLLSSADAAAAGAFLFYGQCFCFAWLSHKAWPGWVSDCQGGWRRRGVGRMQCSTWCKIDAAQSVSDNSNNSEKRSSNSNNNIVVSGVINISVDILWVAFFFFLFFFFCFSFSHRERVHLFSHFFCPFLCTFSYVLSRLLVFSPPQSFIYETFSFCLHAQWRPHHLHWNCFSLFGYCKIIGQSGQLPSFQSNNHHGKLQQIEWKQNWKLIESTMRNSL